MEPAWAVRPGEKEKNPRCEAQVAPALALQGGASPSVQDARRALPGHKASLGRESHGPHWPATSTSQ